MPRKRAAAAATPVPAPWPRPAKIAFIGSHGIRKTSALLAFAAEVQRAGRSVELGREVVRDNPLGINEGATGEAQLWVLVSQVRQELELGRKADVLATDRGVISPDVRLLGGTGSGYNASGDSILLADFRPNSAVVRTSAATELRGSWTRIIEGGTSLPYALLGFTDATGPEASNAQLRADRARPQLTSRRRL